MNYPFNVITTQMEELKPKAQSLPPQTPYVLLLGCSDVLEGQKREHGWSKWSSLRKFKRSVTFNIIQHKASFKESLHNSVTLLFFLSFLNIFTELSESTKQRNNKTADLRKAWRPAQLWHGGKTTNAKKILSFQSIKETKTAIWVGVNAGRMP